MATADRVHECSASRQPRVSKPSAVSRWSKQDFLVLYRIALWAWRCCWTAMTKPRDGNLEIEPRSRFETLPSKNGAAGWTMKERVAALVRRPWCLACLACRACLIVAGARSRAAAVAVASNEKARQSAWGTWDSKLQKRAHQRSPQRSFVWPTTRSRCMSQRPHQPGHTSIFPSSHSPPVFARVCAVALAAVLADASVRGRPSLLVPAAPASSLLSAPFHSHRAALPRSAKILTSFPLGMPQPTPRPSKDTSDIAPARFQLRFRIDTFDCTMFLEIL